MSVIKWGYNNEKEVIQVKELRAGSMKLGLNEIGRGMIQGF